MYSNEMIEIFEEQALEEKKKAFIENINSRIESYGITCNDEGSVLIYNMRMYNSSVGKANVDSDYIKDVLSSMTVSEEEVEEYMDGQKKLIRNKLDKQ